MKGFISTYLPEKHYGFIRGVDGKAYFFHHDAVKDHRQLAHICEAAAVTFDEKATPKGYRADNLVLLKPSTVAKYTIPDTFITTRSAQVKGWDMVERSEWLIYGTSHDSAEAAKSDMIMKATRLGAQALIEVRYFKTTGNAGNYIFTIHNYSGRVVTLAKKCAQGDYEKDHLLGLNARICLIKHDLERKTAKSRLRQRLIWMTLITFMIWGPISVEENSFVSALILLLGAIYSRSTDYDNWVEKA